MLPPMTTASPKLLRSMCSPQCLDDSRERRTDRHAGASSQRRKAPLPKVGGASGTEGQVRLFLREAALHGEQRRLRAIFELQLGEDRADIALHGAFREMQLVADLPIAHAARNQVQHAALTLREQCQRVGLSIAQLLYERALRERMQPRLTARDRPQRVEEVRLGHVLEDVALCTGRDDLAHLAVFG